MFKRFLFISFFFISSQLMAQYYQTGVEPFSTKWRQIRTNNFKILFPAEAEKMANRYANLLSVIDTITPKSLLANQKSFDVVLHNHSVLSNGFVALAPLRMEIIAQPSMSTYAQLWLKQLALHETRHTSQFSKLNGGIIKPLSIFIGGQSNALAAGFVPFWFLEGDAVAFETAASNTGRGRQADFYQYYRTHYLTRSKRFKYDKWLMGSYRDNIPNHYSFGYQLVSYGKLKYGDQLWANTLRYVSRYPFTFFPFYFGLKQQTGLSRKQLFQETFNHLDSLWSKDQKETESVNYKSLVKESKEYTDYRYPYLLNDSMLVAYKSNLSVIPRFVLVNLRTKNEKTLIRSGSLTSIPSYYKNKIFWTEYLPHIRWEYKNFSIIKYYNSSTRKLKTISVRGKYFSPVFNPSDSLVYAVSTKDDGSCTIEGFNLNGDNSRTISLPFNVQPFELFYNIEKNYLLVGVVTDKGKSILKVDEKGTCELVYDPTFIDIHSFTANGDYIFFSATSGYKEDVFSYNTETKALNQQTKSAYGATDPKYVADSKEIVFSNYSEKGYCISKVKVDTENNSVSFKEINDNPISRSLSANEKFNIDSAKIPENTFKSEKYRGLKTLFNIHSWTPFFFDPNQLIAGEINIKPGISLFSQNLTGSSVLMAGYGYDKTSITRIRYDYYGLFPVISYEFDLSNKYPSIYYISDTKFPRTDQQRIESTVSVYTPLTLSASEFSTQIVPFVQFVNSNDYLFSTSDNHYHRGLNTINYQLNFSFLQRKAIKNIRPRLGIETKINFEHAPFNRNNLGSLFSSSLNLYLPGIIKNQSILLHQSFQKQNIQKFFFTNKFVFPRGYNEFYTENLNAITAEYLMPIAYPDLPIGSLVYLKRFSLNSFFDYGTGHSSYHGKVVNKEMRSFGFEMFVDVNFFRTRYPIRLKFQQGWVGDNLNAFNSFSMYIDFYGQ